MAITLIIVGGTLFVSFLLKYFVSDRFRFPAVTLYVVLGVAGGISLAGVYNGALIEHLTFISKLALGVIAFIIGSELSRDVLAALGRSIMFIAFFEAFIAFGMVTGAVLLFTSYPVYYAVILGAVASATAPAATVAVIRQYRAKGPLTSTIMGVVGVDDAISLIIFVFASGFAAGMMGSGGKTVSTAAIVFKPFLEILLSFGIGGIAGLFYLLILRKIRDDEVVRMAIFAFILLLLGVSEKLEISELLTIMAFGVTLANSDKFTVHRARLNLEGLSPLLLPLFFILAGARLNIALIGPLGLLGLLYTGARMSGKIGGAALGAWLGKAPKIVRKWVGFSLVPQVGVAVALALAVHDKFGGGAYGKNGILMSDIVINLLLFTTVFTEVVGPFLTRLALRKAGEIEEKK